MVEDLEVQSTREQPDTQMGEIPATGPKLLLVDDYAKNIDLFGGLLREEGYQVIPASDGPEALAAAALYHPDLILLDVMMPGMSGYEVLQTLKADEALREIPVIFLTALSDEDQEEKGLNMGAVDYITKPVNLPIALARIRTHIALSNATRTLAEQNEQLLEGVKLRDEVDRIMRHDLKTPLTGIVGFPSLILQNKDVPSEQAELLRRIQEAGRRIGKMINSSLDLYRMETGQYEFRPQPLDLVPLLGEIIAETLALRNTRAIGVTLMRSGAPVEPGTSFTVLGEEMLSYSMFSNLLLNAVEASPSGGEIEIDLLDGSPAVVAIRNEGEVPEEIREKFFDKYVTSGKQRGTGLGTYSAHLSAKTQNGRLILDTSEPGHTTIRVELPTEA